MTIITRLCCRNADEKLEWAESHVAGADGELGERVQQPRRCRRRRRFGRRADPATVAGIVRSTVRDHRQRETGPGGGPSVTELRLQICDTRRRLHGQIRSHIHER